MKNKTKRNLIIGFLYLTIISCHNKDRGLIITTDELKEIDTLEFHKLEDFDSLKRIRDSTYKIRIPASSSPKLKKDR